MGLIERAVLSDCHDLGMEQLELERRGHSTPASPIHDPISLPRRSSLVRDRLLMLAIPCLWISWWDLWVHYLLL